eukprot:COSAG02_NODE_843_length_16599_cov_6.528485_16_plen_412_part_00
MKKKGEDDIVVEARAHKDFVVEIDGPDDFKIAETTQGTISLVHEKLEPLFTAHGIGNTNDCLESGGPLFRIILMRLGENTVAYCVEVCHIFADGATYYTIVKIINDAVQGKPPEALVWKPAPQSVPIPVAYNEADTSIMMGEWMEGFMENLGKYAPGTDDERVVDIAVVNPTSASQLKKEYSDIAQKKGVPFVSTNDLIQAGCCAVADEQAIANMFANLRGRLDGVTADLAGNYERGVAFPAILAADDPAFVRTISKEWSYYGLEGNPRMSDEGPRQAALGANFMIVTNWSSLTHFIQPAGTTIVCHCAAKQFVASLAGIDMAVVFKGDSDGTLVMMSNFTKGKRGRELKERIEGSKIFQRLFKPPSLKNLSNSSTSAQKGDQGGCIPNWMLPAAVVAVAAAIAVAHKKLS